MKKRKVKKTVYYLLGVLVVSILFVVLLMVLPKDDQPKTFLLDHLVNKTKEEVITYGKKHQLDLKIQEQYHQTIPAGKVISQNVQAKTEMKAKQSLVITISKGPVPTEVYRENKVDELGKVPIMMYHKIVDMKSSETKYTGGNVDKEGYNRTTEAFRKDLEFYYQEGYRMIRLIDYVEGIIDVPLGKSPIVLTFDDGNEDNIKVTGLDQDGNIIIDPNSAVGILEEFKKKYPDFQVTATFFINQGVFQQKEYNQQILDWLVEHGYDVGNHTMTHPDFTKISATTSLKEVGGIYKILEDMLPKKYVPIIALPFGSPYKTTHPNYGVIEKGTYEGLSYQTKAILRVGWDAEVSPFDKDFTPLFLKRIRAYDNNGVDFDITMCFDRLNGTKYISDGDKDTIVIPDQKKDQVADTLQDGVITY